MTPEMMCALYRSMAPAAFAEALASLLAAARAEARLEALEESADACCDNQCVMPLLLDREKVKP